MDEREQDWQGLGKRRPFRHERETMTNQLLGGLPPTHPGEILREDVIPALGLSKAQVARALKTSRQNLYKILDEESPVTPSMALRLARAFVTTPEFWLNLQQAWDMALVGEAEAGVLDQVEALKAA